MITAGIDIGSRTIKLVLLSNGEIVHSKVVDNSYNTMDICRDLLKGKSYERITATGYGRHLFAEHFQSEIISEIKAFALGVRHFFPDARTILDIGGQDTKAISLDKDGKVKKFEMNDKCAAGTGRFLEIMAMALRYHPDEFGDAALRVTEKETISSMCTVFAESEVISMLGRGYDREKIARGIHHAIVVRATAMLRKIGIDSDLVFVGGVARNKAIHLMLANSTNVLVHSPENPQIFGALGCALHYDKSKI